MRNLKLFALLFLVPLLLLLVGGWQRAQFNGIDARRVALQSEIAQRSAPKTVDFGSAGSIAINRANVAGLHELKLELLALEPTQATVHWRGPLPWVTLLCAGMALVLACAAVFGTHQLAQQARKSREVLLDNFSKTLSYVPFVMSTLTIFVAVAGASSCAYFAMSTYREQMNDREGKLVMLAALMALALLWAAGLFAWRSYQAAQHRADREPLWILGRNVLPSDSPRLWSWVADIAKRLHAQAPDHIVVGLSEGFYVTSHPVVLHPTEQTLSGRTLHLPLAHLALLSEAENTAIVAHELAHFAGEDTHYSMRFLPIYEGVQRSLEATQAQMDDNWIDAIFLRPAWYFGSFFLQQFDFAVNHFSRERELIADAAGAKLVGSEVAASALLRSACSATAIHAALQQVTRSSATGEDVITVASHHLVAHGFDEPDAHLNDVTPHPSDTHPPMRQRLVSFGQVADEALFAQATRGVDPAPLAALEHFVSDPQGLAQTLTHDVVDNYRLQVQRQLAARKASLEA